MPKHTPKTQPDMEHALDLRQLLDRIHNRCTFLKLMGQGLGYSALAASLPGCGSGGSDGGNTNPPPPPLPPNTLSAASAEYTTLKRTSFGVQGDALAATQSMGINAYLETQLDYRNIDDGNLENTIAGLFPLTK